MILSGLRSVDGMLGPGQWGAEFSDCGNYRYRLWREFRVPDAKPMWRINFIMLNPSTADHDSNDPTVERCMRRAIDWGYDALDVTNIFALRSTDPYVLKAHAEPIGASNDEAIVSVAQQADTVIVAWGQHGTLGNRSKAVLDMLREAGVDPLALKVAVNGLPCHPLYLPYSLEPKPYFAEVPRD